MYYIKRSLDDILPRKNQIKMMVLDSSKSINTVPLDMKTKASVTDVSKGCQSVNHKMYLD